MREQTPGANLLHESVLGASSLVCTELCLPWHDVSPVGQSNWLIFSSTTHCEPNRVVSSFSSLVVSFVCTGWGTYPGACFRSKLPRVNRRLRYSAGYRGSWVQCREVWYKIINAYEVHTLTKPTPPRSIMNPVVTWLSAQIIDKRSIWTNFKVTQILSFIKNLITE